MEAKPTTISCRGCGKSIRVRELDIEAGSVTCSQKGCTTINSLFSEHYDPAILNGLPSFGTLVSVEKPNLQYALQAGKNIIGVSQTATVRLERDQYLHNGLMHISGRHCTLEVEFNIRTGRLAYFVQDGAIDPDNGKMKKSTNTTILNGRTIKPGEMIGVTDKTLINLGGLDTFRLVPYQIPVYMLETYKRSVFDPHSFTKTV